LWSATSAWFVTFFAMTLPGHVFTNPNGVRGFDTSETVTARAAALMHRAGYRFAVRYVRRARRHPSTLTATESRRLLDAGLGVMLVQYVESESSWTPSAGKGTQNGTIAADEAESLGFPWGVTIWCDLEGVGAGTSSRSIIDYCNRWHEAVSAAGFVPGIYVGYHARLSPLQLYRSLRFTHYWAAYNLNADQYPAVRGVQMRQLRAATDAIPSGVGISFQADRVMSDVLGGRPTLLALDGWPELP
jgi:hypothetical protein